MKIPGTNITFADLYELTVLTVKDAIEDRVPGLSAEVAFFALFSLPPTILALLGAAGYLGQFLGPDVTTRIVEEAVAASRNAFTDEAVRKVVQPTLTSLLNDGRADVFSIGAVFALWSASRSAYVLLDALQIAYDVEVKRPIWRRRAVAMAFTVGAILLGAIVLPLLVAGPSMGRSLAARFGLADTLASLWTVAYWPIVATLSVLILTLLYHFAIPWKTPFKRDIPGAVLALVMWVIVSYGLRTYASWALTSSSLYGSLAAPMVVLLWLYFTSMALLMGAELNAEIEKKWPTVTAKERAEVERMLAIERGSIAPPEIITDPPPPPEDEVERVSASALNESAAACGDAQQKAS